MEKKHILPNEIETDAEFIFIHWENRKITKISVTGSSYLKTGEKTILNSKEKINKEFEF